MEYACGNILFRPLCAAHDKLEREGDVVEGHAHNFDHATFVYKGRVRVERLSADGSVERAVEVSADDGFGRNFILIKAGTIHRITSLQDGSRAVCIYAHRTPQGEVVQEWTGWEPAYV